VHAELQAFVEAGLTPLQALQTATLNPARFFAATDSLGSVAPGRLADLVLLDADPLVNITNTEKICASYLVGDPSIGRRSTGCSPRRTRLRTRRQSKASSNGFSDRA
jgi:hypothetical protein